MTPAASVWTSHESKSTDNSAKEAGGNLKGRKVKDHTSVDINAPQSRTHMSCDSFASLAAISMLFAAALIGCIVGFALAGTSDNETTRKQGFAFGSVGAAGTLAFGAGIYKQIKTVKET